MKKVKIFPALTFCSFGECRNRITPRTEKELRKMKGRDVLKDTFCDECVESKFTQKGSPKILSHWRRKIEKKAETVTRIIYGDEIAKERTQALKTVKFIPTLRKYKNLRTGIVGQYFGNNRIELNVRKCSTETQFISVYVHEISHHFVFWKKENKSHGEEFVRFIRALIHELEFEITHCHRKKNGDIRWDAIMDIKLPPRKHSNFASMEKMEKMEKV